MLPPSPPSRKESECIMSTLHQEGGMGTPKSLALVLVTFELFFCSFVVNIISDNISLTRLSSQLKI